MSTRLTSIITLPYIGGDSTQDIHQSYRINTMSEPRRNIDANAWSKPLARGIRADSWTKCIICGYLRQHLQYLPAKIRDNMAPSIYDLCCGYLWLEERFIPYTYTMLLPLDEIPMMISDDGRQIRRPELAMYDAVGRSCFAFIVYIKIMICSRCSSIHLCTLSVLMVV